jgi:hypothetical protein
MFVGFEVLTPVVMKSTVFRDTTLCGPLKVDRRFERTYRLHLQGRRISKARSQSAGHLFSCWYYALLILRPWRRTRYVPPKRRLIFNGLHGIISQIILFKILSYSVYTACKSDLFYSFNVVLFSCSISTSQHTSNKLKFLVTWLSVTIDGVWICNLIYWTLTDCNYK